MFEDGSTRLRRRELRRRPRQALFLWAVAAVVVFGWIGARRSDAFNRMGIATSVLTLVLVAGAAWLTWERSGWLVRPGRLTFRRSIGPWISEQPFEHAQLAVESTSGSDGDDLYELIVRSGRDRRTIDTAVNDDGEVAECGRWLAARTGFPLVARR